MGPCKAPACSGLTESTAGSVCCKIGNTHDKKILLRDYCGRCHNTVLSVLAMTPGHIGPMCYYQGQILLIMKENAKNHQRWPARRASPLDLVSAYSVEQRP